jgi:Rrf2 family protein
MKISIKANYSLHALIYLAAVNGEHAATIDEIASAESIPRDYLARVLNTLGHAGLIRGKKGILGGYYLTKPRRKYTFLEIIEAVEGPLIPCICLKTDSKRSHHRKGKCAAFAPFNEIRKMLMKELSSITLEDIPYHKFYKPGVVRTYPPGRYRNQRKT